MEEPYGQTNYEAYCEQRRWKAFDGKPLPQWAEVSPDIQAAWDEAAWATISEYNSRQLNY